MLCGECEKVLDLDISYPVVFDDNASEETRRIRHHLSFSALSQAAGAGCKLCQHVSQKSRGGCPTATSDSLLDPRMQIKFEVFSDSLIFSIPRRIEFDDSGENFDIGEESVKVYVSTEESLFSVVFVIEPSDKPQMTHWHRCSIGARLATIRVLMDVSSRHPNG